MKQPIILFSTAGVGDRAMHYQMMTPCIDWSRPRRNVNMIGISSFNLISFGWDTDSCAMATVCVDGRWFTGRHGEVRSLWWNFVGGGADMWAGPESKYRRGHG